MNRHNLPGQGLTTAMGIMPHTDLQAALQIALSLDIPFWPQLPRMSYYEDMYAQASEKFPGLTVDTAQERIAFDTAKFYEELPLYFQECETPGFYELSPQYSLAFQGFLSQNLENYPVIRGQNVGPVSFGFKITDENRRPILYNDEIREFLFDFIAAKTNAQYQQLQAKHPQALVWLDEPGLQMLFSSYTGYTTTAAARDYREFLDKLAGPKGVHLCGNIDWSFLLTDLDLDILSLDSYSVGHIFTRYKDEVVAFLRKGGIIAWGITPTLTEEIAEETEDKLVKRLQDMFSYLTAQGISLADILERSWFAPSRCCLVNPDRTKSVEQSLALLKNVARRIVNG